MISEALSVLAPGAEWSLADEDLSTLIWYKGERPTDEEILAKAEELQLQHELTEYRRLRAPEYPSIGDQLDALFHAGVFPPEMEAQIQAVKDKYPKPEDLR